MNKCSVAILNDRMCLLLLDVNLGPHFVVLKVPKQCCTFKCVYKIDLKIGSLDIYVFSQLELLILCSVVTI